MKFMYINVEINLPHHLNYVAALRQDVVSEDGNLPYGQNTAEAAALYLVNASYAIETKRVGLYSF